MLTALILIVLAAIAALLVLLAVVVVGIRQEPRTELSNVAPSPFTAMIRRMVGLYVRRPTCSAVRAPEHGEGSPAGPAPRPRTTTWPHGERR
jgi:hypothetical protein